jgi:hypothetical protein
MKFALLGCDSDTLELALEIASRPEHQLVWASELGEHTPVIRAAAPGILLADPWETLLGGTVADAVIVSRASDQEQRMEQLRKLAQVGTAMIVSHPALESMLAYYELDMIRQESRATMLPYGPAWRHPAWRRLAELCGDGGSQSLGQLEQIVVEHISPARSRGEVLYAFVRQMELVRPFCGVLNKVSAMTSSGVRSSAEAVNYGTLNVQMASLSTVLVRWSVMAGATENTRFTFLGMRGKAILEEPRGGAWRLEHHHDDQAGTEDFADWKAATAALPHLLERLTAPCGEDGDRSQSRDNFEPDWLGACRTMELADAVQHSLERGRTIELHYEAPSEHATFKGVMSGVGCLLLLAGLLVLVVATTAVNAGVPLARHWPYLLVAVLGVFLLLQSLKLVFSSDS